MKKLAVMTLIAVPALIFSFQNCTPLKIAQVSKAKENKSSVLMSGQSIEAPDGYSGTGGDCLDTLDFFLPNVDWQSLSGHTQIYFGNGNEGGKYTVKANKYAYEYHVWNKDAIYVKFDSSNWPEPPYSFDTGKWMPRWWCVGQEENVVTIMHDWRRDQTAWGTPDYSWSKMETGQRTYRYTMRFLAHTNVNLGGNLGEQEVIIVRYERSGGWEDFTYSKQHGWIRWQQNDGQEVWMNWFDHPVGPESQLNPNP